MFGTRILFQDVSGIGGKSRWKAMSNVFVALNFGQGLWIVR